MQNTTQNAALNREDLLNILERLSPEDTPVYNRLNKANAAKSMLTEFGLDDLGDPDFGGKPEGKDITNYDNKSKNKVKVGNRQEKFQETYSVSEEQTLVDAAGNGTEVGDAKAKSNIELKIDMESAICSDQVQQAGSGADDSRMSGLGALSDPAYPLVPARYRTPPASVGVTAGLTEPSFRAVLQSRFVTTGRKGRMVQFNGPNLQDNISDFTRAEGTTTQKSFSVNIMAEKKMMILSVMEYVSDWGIVDMIPTLFNARTSGSGILAASLDRGYGLSPDMNEIRFLQRPFQVQGTE